MMDSYVGNGNNEKLRQITIKRLDQFTNTCDCYFDKGNLSKSRFYADKILVDLSYWSNPPNTIVTFQEAVLNFFQPCEIGHAFGPSWSTHWFRLQFEVPGTWSLDEVHLLFDCSSEALLFNESGSPIQGFIGSSDGVGDRRYEYLLTPPYLPTYTFFVEMVCNGLFGVGKDGIINSPDLNKFFVLRKAEISVFNRDVFDLYFDFTMISDMAKFLPSDSVRSQQALRLGNKLVNEINPLDQSTFKTARLHARTFLNKSNGESQHKIYAVGHCHIDVAWLWRTKESRRKSARSWSSQLRLIEEYREIGYKFGISQAQLLDWVRIDYPELFIELQSEVAKGGICLQGGTWVEMDTNLPNGESLIRQFLIGQTFFETYFNQRCKVFWLPDTFGYSASLPQIIIGCGCKYFMSQKLSWNTINKFDKSSFKWVGIDGTEVLTHFPPSETYNASGSIKELAESVKKFNDKGSSNTSLLSFGNGDGGGGPQRDHLERLKRVKNCEGLPQVTFASTMEFFIQLEMDRDNLTSYIGELYFELHRGTYTTQSQLKKYNRMLEVLINAAEYLLTLSSVMRNSNYPRVLMQTCWKKLLLNQFHDILPGSCIFEAVKDAIVLYEEVSKSLASLINNSIDQLFPAADSDSKKVFFNSISCRRREIVIVDNKPVYVEIDGLGFSYESILSCPFENVTFFHDLETDKITVGNQFLICRFNSAGKLESMVFKIDGREVIDSSINFGNSFVIFDDIPIFWDVWDVELYHLQTKRSIDGAFSFKILMVSECRVVLEFRYALSSVSNLVETVELDSTMPYLKFACVCEWRETHKFLKVEFPVSVRSSNASYDSQFGHIQRPTHFNTYKDLAQFEVSAQKFADLSEFDFGVSLINDCKHGYSIFGNVMSLSLLRSPKAPDDQADMGIHTFAFALLPHGSTFQKAGVIQVAMAFNAPILSFEIPTLVDLPLPLFKCSNCSISISAVKYAESSDCVILRAYEMYGGHASVTFTSSICFANVVECNLVEHDILNLTFLDRSFCASFSPFQIRTFKIIFNNKK